MKAFLVVEKIFWASQTAAFCHARLAIIVFQLTFAQGNAQDNALISQVAPDFLKFPEILFDIPMKIPFSRGKEIEYI